MARSRAARRKLGMGVVNGRKKATGGMRERGTYGKSRPKDDHSVKRAREVATDPRLQRAKAEQEEHELRLRALEAELAASVQQYQAVATTTTEEIVMSAPNAQPELTVKQVAEILGVTHQTVLNLVAAGRLIPDRIEKLAANRTARFFNQAQIDAFAESYTKQVAGAKPGPRKAEPKPKPVEPPAFTDRAEEQAEAMREINQALAPSDPTSAWANPPTPEPEVVEAEVPADYDSEAAYRDAGSYVEAAYLEARTLLAQGYHIARVVQRTGVPVVDLQRFVGKDGYAKGKG
jgi:hypothetical protein